MQTYDYLTEESEYLTDELEAAFDLLFALADVDDWEEIPEVSCYIIEKETDRVKLAHIKSIISLYR
jgi:hypothetical protein